MSEGSQVSKVTICVKILKGRSVSDLLTKVMYRAARADINNLLTTSSSHSSPILSLMVVVSGRVGACCWCSSQCVRMSAKVCPEVEQKWKWSDDVGKHEKSIFQCISMTNNLKSCQKIYEKNNCSDFTRWRKELCAENSSWRQELGNPRYPFLNNFP